MHVLPSLPWTYSVWVPWPHTNWTLLAEASEPLGHVWQVSRWQPWVEPVGTFSSSCYRGRRVPWAAFFTLFFLKVFLCLPAGYCVFCPPPPPAPWHLLRTKPQVLNILSCLNLPSAGFLSLSPHVWLYFFFFFKSLKSNFTPSLHPFGAPHWRCLLWFLYCFSRLKPGNMIFPSSATHLSKTHWGTKAWLKAQVLLESLRRLQAPDPEPQQACAWPDLSSVLVVFPLVFLSLLPSLSAC